MARIVLVSRARLQRALDHVAAELAGHGFWTSQLRQVNVCLAPVGYALGWYRRRIVIPTISGSRLIERYLSAFTCSGLRSTLRHEYGHALADMHPGALRKLKFRSVFGGDYDPATHVTRYAGTDAGEDFCETVMLYLKYNGHTPRHYTRQVAIRRKFSFVRRLGKTLANK